MTLYLSNCWYFEYKIFFKILISFSFTMYQEVRLMDHGLVLFYYYYYYFCFVLFNFSHETFLCFLLLVSVVICIPFNRIQQFLFLSPILAKGYFFMIFCNNYLNSFGMIFHWNLNYITLKIIDVKHVYVTVCCL